MAFIPDQRTPLLLGVASLCLLLIGYSVRKRYSRVELDAPPIGKPRRAH